MDDQVNDRSGAWRPLVAVSGALLFVGGGMHPEAPDDLSFRDNLAAMMADDAWVPGHSLMAIGAAVLLVALLIVRRRGSWPEAAKIVPFAVVAMAVNVVELILHTASVVDKEELAAGESPVVTMAHLGAAVLAYPLFGAAIALLAWQLMRSWSVPLRAVSAAGIVGGIANGLAAPLVILTQKQDFDVLFAIGGIATAVWLVVLGLAGVRVPAPRQRVVAAA